MNVGQKVCHAQEVMVTTITYFELVIVSISLFLQDILSVCSLVFFTLPRSVLSVI